ncbi:hypothetical protein TrVE_jg3916 [Triparma verrucosa]|uniref:RING-type domain-containing protein n=2 Tax=Triparma TaxID=722752 RepID=A0A9W7BWZ2_9STRA|nr:hypothetical protein TrST_g13681 [Triparma strigata]GMH99743.1 hypothetical protein TrVE_jg3916 [Triparma verrucosa]
MDDLTCAICLDSTTFVDMPCCGATSKSSTVQFCFECIETITQMDAFKVGACPRCRKFVAVESEKIVLRERTGKCNCCMQQHVIVARGRCQKCLLGSNYAFRYQCDKCNRIQRIPHPMWLYQPSPTSYGGATWACHVGQRCEYTHWRILPDDVGRIPANHVPESWGGQEEMFESVRIFRNQQRMREEEGEGGFCVVS